MLYNLGPLCLHEYAVLILINMGGIGGGGGHNVRVIAFLSSNRSSIRTNDKRHKKLYLIPSEHLFVINSAQLMVKPSYNAIRQQTFCVPKEIVHLQTILVITYDWSWKRNYKPVPRNKMARISGVPSRERLIKAFLIDGGF